MCESDLELILWCKFQVDKLDPGFYPVSGNVLSVLCREAAQWMQVYPTAEEINSRKAECYPK